jgi:NADH:ubiquinone oxidoreductase subunit F (NADH-binding)/NADH:ubiquinone oxidoreductase subunit E
VHPSTHGRSSSDFRDATAFGDKARAVEEILQRNRGESAALVSTLVELSKALGPLTPAALGYVALKLRLPEASVVELAQAHRLAIAGEQVAPLGLCINGPCAARGGSEVERILREKSIDFEPLGCQGACDLGPIACYNRGAPLSISAARARSLAKADPRDWEDLLSVEKPVHAFKTEPRVAFANIFAKGSHQLATARRHGVYAPVEKALAASPEQLLALVEASGVVGAGGDGLSVAARWRRVREAPGARKYLVVDGLESEPGASKDRVLLERDPHLVIAGALLACWATGASEIFIVVRGEYELATERFRAAVDAPTRAGLAGEGALGPERGLPIHVRLAPGHYLTGEQSALIETLEGRAPRPRRNGEPVESSGLFGAPTLVHNVETLATLPGVAEHGAEWYRGLGVGGAVGTKVVSLGGDVARPGNYEVARGTRLSEIVHGLGGGPAQGKVVVAIQLGGAYGAYLPANALELPYDQPALAARGATVGSGSVVVVSEKACLVDLARRETAYFVREGCGVCACLPRRKARPS